MTAAKETILPRALFPSDALGTRLFVLEAISSAHNTKSSQNRHRYTGQILLDAKKSANEPPTKFIPGLNKAD